MGFATANLTRRDDWAALGTGTLETGATALLVAALGERRLQTGDPAHDELLGELGRFLLAQTEPDGTVLSEWSTAHDAPVAGRTSAFSTGETWLAFSRLERLFPSQGWREPAERVGRYVMEQARRRGGHLPTDVRPLGCVRAGRDAAVARASE